MRKLILLFNFIFSIFVYANFNLWEDHLEIEPGYKPLEFSSTYFQKNKKIKSDKIKKLDNLYYFKDSININLKDKLSLDYQEKKFYINPDIIYIRYENFKSPIFNLNLGYLIDNTRYGANISILKGKDDIYFQKDIDTEAYQLNLYFNTLKEDKKLFGTFYFGELKYDDIVNEENFYYGYFQTFEQEYESFYYDFLYGYFVYLDILRVETDNKTKSYNNDSIDGNISVFVKKNFNSNFYLKFYSGIGKEFLENKKYNTITQDEFEIYLNEKIELTKKFENWLDLFIGAELKKSIRTSNYEKSFYLGFKLNF